MNIKHMSIGSYQKENDHLIVDLDKELPNLTDVRINGVWFEKSLLKNDEHTSAFYRNRAREEYRRLRELEQLCRDLYNVHIEERKWHGAAPHEHLRDRMEQLGLIHETEYDPDTGMKWGDDYV